MPYKLRGFNKLVKEQITYTQNTGKPDEGQADVNCCKEFV